MVSAKRVDQAGRQRGARWLVIVMSILLLTCCVAIGQLATSVKFQVYHCRFKQAADVQRMLSEILRLEELQVVVNGRANELLLRGPEEAIQQAVRFIRSVDVSPNPASPGASRRVKEEIRAYPCPAPVQVEMVRKMRSQYAHFDQIRITSDSESDKLFVLASPEVHQSIGRWLKDQRPLVGADAAANAGPIRLPSPNTTDTRSPAASVQQTRFLPVRSEPDDLWRRLSLVFGDRLQPSQDTRSATIAKRPTYHIRLGSQQRLTFALDHNRRGISITGSSSAVLQFTRLIRVLDRGMQRGRSTGERTAVLSIHRADRQSLRQAIEAYQGQSTTAPGPDQSRVPQRNVRSARLVGYQAPDEAAEQPSSQAPEEERNDQQPPPDDTIELPDQEIDVEVETLPDLDVIILRGRDRDVEQLREIIQQLERISAKTRPKVSIFYLRHSPSQAIGQIVNQVSDDLTRGRQGRVTVTALVKPNALLLVGWGNSVKAVWELIAKLDQPVSPETEFSVFRLEHAPVTTVQQAVQQFFSNRTGLGTQVQLTADVRSNSLIVYAAPRDMAEVRRLIASLDTAQSGAVNQVRIFDVQNALAADLATTLQTAIQAARGGDATAPSAILELLTVDAEEERVLRSGILTNVKITPNPRNNTLIVSGPVESMDLIDALIRQLDTPGAVAQIKVFRIVNADATSLIQMLRSLLPSQTGAAVGPKLPSVQGETSLAPLRFSIDVRSNSIIATGSEGDLRIIEALLLRLDADDISQRKNEVYRLRNSPAVDVAAAINEFLRSERRVQQAAPGVVSPFEQIEQEVVVVPEPVGNSLIISATPRYFDEIMEMVKKLDEQPPQVMLQVLIAEVALNDTDEFGVELGIQDSVLFDRSLLGGLVTTINSAQTSTPSGIVTATEEIIQAATNTPGFLFNSTQPLGNSGSTRAVGGSNQPGGQGIANFSVGRMNQELGFGGLVLSASSESVSVLIRALQESRRMEILSRPTIRTLDNQPAFIQVGQRVPRIIGSTLNENGQSNSLILENVGLILGVTPRVSPDGTVVLEIDAEKSELGPDVEGIPVSVSIDGTVIRSPRIDTIKAQTTISAADNETIILGGLITNSSSQINRKVPYLGDLPLVGQLFRYDSDVMARTELLIIMTPHVIRTPEDSERIKQMEIARMSWCAADVFSIYDDLGYIAPQTAPASDGQAEVIYPDLQPRGAPPQQEPPPREPDDFTESPLPLPYGMHLQDAISDR